LKTHEIINKAKISFTLFAFLLVLILLGCSGNDELSERKITVKLLTNDSEKYWVLDKSNIDGQPITPSTCDSSYTLVMKADFTWDEIYSKLQCNPDGYGNWNLNDENNVISIDFINPGTGKRETQNFEIEELSESYFAYQFAINNRLKYVRLKAE
jgi:hypothetical protein